MLAHPETQVLAVADRRSVDCLAARDEEGDVGIAEPERRQPVELPRQLERERGGRHDRVDGRHGLQVGVSELAVRASGKRVRERLELGRA